MCSAAPQPFRRTCAHAPEHHPNPHPCTHAPRTHRSIAPLMSAYFALGLLGLVPGIKEHLEALREQGAE